MKRLHLVHSITSNKCLKCNFILLDGALRTANETTWQQSKFNCSVMPVNEKKPLIGTSTQEGYIKSEEYRDAIRRIVKNGMKQHFPGLKQTELNAAARYIARNIHARFYGANVDGVESPLWREIEPNVEAIEILKGKDNEKDSVSSSSGSNYLRDYPERSNSAKLP